MIVYGRNAVREAIRGPRTVSRVWATQNAAREPWLEQAGLRVTLEPADEIDTPRWFGRPSGRLRRCLGVRVRTSRRVAFDASRR